MPNRSREHQIKLYLNDDEFTALKTLLETYGGSMSDFIRTSVLNANVVQLQTFNNGIVEHIKQYKQLGNNLNQLTRAVHKGKCQVDQEELQTIRKELTQLWQLLKQLKAGNP